jgi:prepilin-type N-terminal cleavage/methylation domain-containing protein
MIKPQATNKGFTLIELSIVLVIIGLITGGVLVGRDLINAAYIRAQISQIEKFNTAVNTFYGKYQALPGDMNNQTAQDYGFSMAVHNGAGGQGTGDGNGILESTVGSSCNLGGGCSVSVPSVGDENGVFWVDLSSQVAGNLIEGSFNSVTETSYAGLTSITRVPLFLPAAKLGSGNFVYTVSINGINYYGVQVVTQTAGLVVGTPGMTVSQAYNIDKKVDDGYPTTGNVAAVVNINFPNWAMGGGGSETYQPSGSVFSGIAATAGNAAGPTTCFDAPSVGSTTNYSTEINGGAGLNCALIFKIQGGD